jgi:flagellar assembly protein FliH
LASAFGSRIIKSHYVGPDTYTVSPRASRHDREHAISLVRDASEQAGETLAEARAQAALILEGAAAERDTLLEAMRAEIMEEAQHSVREQLRQETDQTFSHFQQLVQGAMVSQADMRSACYADVLAIAIAVAERVIGRELTTDPTIVEGITEMAMSQVQLEQMTHILVHPNDYSVMDHWATQVLGAQRSAVEIVTDPSVGSGGCVIGTKTGFVDARVETQLVEIRRALADVVEHA